MYKVGKEEGLAPQGCWRVSREPGLEGQRRSQGQARDVDCGGG